MHGEFIGGGCLRGCIHRGGCSGWGGLGGGGRGREAASATAIPAVAGVGGGSGCATAAVTGGGGGGGAPPGASLPPSRYSHSGCIIVKACRQSSACYPFIAECGGGGRGVQLAFPIARACAPCVHLRVIGQLGFLIPLPKSTHCFPLGAVKTDPHKCTLLLKYEKAPVSGPFRA